MNSKNKMAVGDSLWQVLSDSLLNAARGYNPPAYGTFSGQELGMDPLGGMVADMLYQSLSGKDYTQYDAARTAFMDPSIGWTVGGENINPKGNMPTRTPQSEITRPAHRGAARPANIQNIIELIHMMNPPGRK